MAVENGTGDGDGSKYIRDQTMEEEAIGAIQAAAEDVGEPLSRKEYTNWRREQNTDAPSLLAVANRLGLDGVIWADILDIAGIDGEVRVYKYTTEDIESSLKQAADDVGEPLTIEKYQSWRENQEGNVPNAHAVIRFGDGEWTVACELVGITPGDPRGGDILHTDDQIKSALKRAANEIGEPLSYEKYNEWVNSIADDIPVGTTVIRRLSDGSWKAALQSVGIQPDEPDRNKYTKQEVKSALKQAAEEMGDQLPIREYDKWSRDQPEDYPVGETIAERVGGGSWNKAKQCVLQNDD